MVRRPHPLRWLVIAPFAAGAAFGCASSKNNAAAPPPIIAKAPAPAVEDDAACAKICAASASCGDPEQACLAKCTDWLVTRGRPGIASATATCAVPRIDKACEVHHALKSSAMALVSCIDEAGRDVFARDSKTLLVAARAICNRGARCSDGSSEDAQLCLDRLSQGPAPRGLGIFGAVKPELVQRFAACMEETSCTQGASTSCFSDMLGDRDDEDEEDTTAPGDTDEPPGVPTPTPQPQPGEPGTKI